MEGSGGDQGVLRGFNNFINTFLLFSLDPLPVVVQAGDPVHLVGDPGDEVGEAQRDLVRGGEHLVLKKGEKKMLISKRRKQKRKLYNSSSKESLKNRRRRNTQSHTHTSRQIIISLCEQKIVLKCKSRGRSQCSKLNYL